MIKISKTMLGADSKSIDGQLKELIEIDLKLYK